MRKILFALFFSLIFLPPFCFAEMPQLHGFAEMDYGVKVRDDVTRRDNFNLLEQRAQLKTEYYFEGDNYLSEKAGMLNFKGDFVVDEYYSAKTDFELREFNLSFTPFSFMDVKLGRQIITWGTGNYLFINDMFPKDYVSFLIGRDEEYLKKPSDAIKASFYPKFANIDFVIIPSFTPDTQPNGERVSFFDVYTGMINGSAMDYYFVEPAMQMENNEYALRVYKNLGGNELAGYFFHGFDKSPNSFKDQLNSQFYYERLDVYGASLRGAIAGGIGNIEMGYYNSREDPDGSNRLIANSLFKSMVGYTKDLGNDLKVGFQYYYEQKLDYKNYVSNLLPGDFFWDEFNHVVTNSIEKLFKNQTVRVSLFTFYSPCDRDGYVRPSISYDVNDRLKVTCGANIFWGEDDQTNYGQLKHNKNVYFRVKYSF